MKGQRKFIQSLDVDRRITEIGLNFDRADVITFGLDIYLKAMKWSGCSRIYVPKIGVSDGLIRDLYHRSIVLRLNNRLFLPINWKYQA